MSEKSEKGWIKIHRGLADWEWKDSPKHVSVFLDCLINANHQSNKYRGVDIPAGSFTTSYNKVAVRCGISVQSVRTILRDLISTHEITCQSTRHYSMISIVKWSDYQMGNTPSNIEVTSKQQPTNIEVTTNKNVKKERKKEVYILVDFWNELQIIKHQPNDKNLDRIEKAISKKKDFDIDTVKIALSNYSKVVLDPNSYFKYKWPLWDFLKREGAEKFYPDLFVESNYKSHQIQNMRPTGAKNSGHQGINGQAIYEVCMSSTGTASDPKLSDINTLTDIDRDFIQSNGGRVQLAKKYDVRKFLGI